MAWPHEVLLVARSRRLDSFDMHDVAIVQWVANGDRGEGGVLSTEAWTAKGSPATWTAPPDLGPPIHTKWAGVHDERSGAYAVEVALDVPLPEGPSVVWKEDHANPKSILHMRSHAMVGRWAETVRSIHTREQRMDTEGSSQSALMSQQPASRPQLTPPIPWLGLVITAVATTALLFLPLPGIDRQLVTNMSGVWASRLPVFLAPLALVGLATSPRTDTSVGRTLWISALLCTGGLAWWHLAWLANPALGYTGMVFEPGLGARALGALSGLAVHAVLMALAMGLDGPRVHGLWWVVAVAYALQWGTMLPDVWWVLAQGDMVSALVRWQASW